MNLLASPWFYWALGVAIGLPVGLVVLTEWHNALVRRESPLARPVGMVRNYLLPLGALLLLLVRATQVPAADTSVRVVATVFGFVVLVVVLSGLNATIFDSAPEGTWRSRMPGIFIDVARFVLIALGLAVIFSYIWGANVGGLFTALGVSSIVIGLALQNSVGQIISGLLMLFEQPFELGDWLDTPSARGRVVEVNWRAVHIDTGSGLQVTPNSVLAGASFTNLSRPAGRHTITVATTFSIADSPDLVCAMLTRVAGMLPQRKPDVAPATVAAGSAQYRTTIALTSPADDAAARSTFLRWSWYAARREDLHLDGADDDFNTAERIDKALRAAGPTLRLSVTDQQKLAEAARIVRYGADEILQHPGEVPSRMSFLVGGRVRLTATTDDGSMIPVATLEEGAFIGQTTLTRQPVLAGAYALEEV
ncbi:MAG TPA: mechanosensitive ion channel family protein, partial [Mycobacterium sp.]|nr:mechanosensitive ion channel family protein [Mycobacterium sp.]